jgi:hypothetical protein
MLVYNLEGLGRVLTSKVKNKSSIMLFINIILMSVFYSNPIMCIYLIPIQLLCAGEENKYYLDPNKTTMQRNIIPLLALASLVAACNNEPAARKDIK